MICGPLSPILSSMHIAITSSGLGHTARGIEAWAKSLAEGLHREGEQVTLFHGGGTYTCPNIQLNYLHRDTLPLRLLTRLAPRFTWRWGLTNRYALEQRLFTRSLLKCLGSGHSAIRTPHSALDIIHTQDYVVARRLHQVLSHPHSAIRTPHSPRVIFCNVTDEPPASLAGLPYLQHVSQPDYDAALACPALHPHIPKHFLVPSFVDVTRFAPAGAEQKASLRRKFGIPETAFVIGCVAALQRKHKRLDSLIDEVATFIPPSAFGTPAVPHSAFHLPHSFHPLLCGATTDDTPYIERYARDVLGSNVTILKDQPFDAMPAIYQAMDLYVHPAPDEVFGICLLEAMASGIPVVAHHSPRLKYVVGEGGWLTDVTQPGFLAAQWAALTAALPAAAEQARRHVEARFSWAAVYPAYMTMYREVVG